MAPNFMISPRTVAIVKQKQFKIFGMLFVLVILGNWVLSSNKSLFFERFLGGLHPVAAIFISGILGVIALFVLSSKRWFEIHKKYPIRKVIPYGGLTLLFALTAIGIDF